MLHIWDIYGKYVLLEGEYALSIQVSIKVEADEYGECVDFYHEYVKVLDQDSFEIEEIGISVAHAYPGKEVVVTALLRLYDNSDFIKEAKYLQLFDTVAEIKDIDDNQELDIYLEDRIRHYSQVNPTSETVPLLACKLKTKGDETLISIKATYSPEPDEDGQVQDLYFEYAQLLDAEGYEIEEAGLSFKNAEPYKPVTSTAIVTFYDNPSLVKKIAYIRFFDAVISIHDPYNQIHGIEKPISKVVNKENNCSICGSLTLNTSEICNKCENVLSEKNSISNSVSSPLEDLSREKNYKIQNEQELNRCESCQCKLPITETMCDFCKTARIKEKILEELKQKEEIENLRTSKSELKQWPQHAPLDSPPALLDDQKKSFNIWGIIIVLIIFALLLKSCF